LLTLRIVLLTLLRFNSPKSNKISYLRSKLFSTLTLLAHSTSGRRRGTQIERSQAFTIGTAVVADAADVADAELHAVQ